ncbi:MAG: 50S ribosomal protein L11 methyltransferase [Chitinophagaceae bacterium]|nr:50S ribosomal protein L11 methyltransferase [Chitinophagaceae bacterium]
MNYIQLDFELTNQDRADQLIALLSEQGFEGFEEEKNHLKAFIAESNFNENEIKLLTGLFNDLVYVKSTVKNINWNEQWENSFEPIRIGSFVAVRASFHPPVTDVQHEMIITPKMSFGTGHHATTYLMLQQMQHINFCGKSVFDFGTGTGVLAILAQKLGAAKVIAIDNDEWSINNAKENIDNNPPVDIQIYQSDCIKETEQFDIILANINLNVIVDHMPSITSIAKNGAVILLSGFFKSDENTILSVMQKYQLIHKNTVERNEWICIAGEKK